jgi:manganese/zinc/iron transport system permease protein
MTMVAFDPGYAATLGIDTRRVDLADHGARDGGHGHRAQDRRAHPDRRAAHHPAGRRAVLERAERDGRADRGRFSAGLSGYLGAAISASAPEPADGADHRAGGLRPLRPVAAVAPGAGSLAAGLRRGAISCGCTCGRGCSPWRRALPVHEAWTRRLLVAEGLIRPDGVPTEAGRRAGGAGVCATSAAGRCCGACRDEAAASLYDGLRDIETVLTPDEIAEIDRRLGGLREVRHDGSGIRGAQPAADGDRHCSRRSPARCRATSCSCGGRR